MFENDYYIISTIVSHQQVRDLSNLTSTIRNNIELHPFFNYVKSTTFFLPQLQ